MEDVASVKFFTFSSYTTALMQKYSSSECDKSNDVKSKKKRRWNLIGIMQNSSSPTVSKFLLIQPFSASAEKDPFT